MVTVDCHLHLGVIDQHTPAWWWWEQFGFEPASVDGEAIIEFLDSAGLDVGMVQGGDIRRNTFNPDSPHDRNMYVPNEFTARQCEMYPDRLYGVIGVDPLLDVQESLFTLDKRVMTCSGGLAGVDLMLRLIEEINGSSFSGEIADQMLHHPIRSATSPQRSTMGRSTETMLPLLREAMTLIENNIEEPLTVPQIAQFLNVSQRQLERQFKKNVGCTVVQFGLLRRLQNARLLLISTEMSIRQIATASGFNTLSHFAYSFGKFFGRRPSDYREAWPTNEPAPSWPGSLSDFLDTINGHPPKD